MYRSVLLSRWMVKARSPLADQAKPVAPSSRRWLGDGVRSRTMDPAVECTASSCPFGDAARPPGSPLRARAPIAAASPTSPSVPSWAAAGRRLGGQACGARLPARAGDQQLAGGRPHRAQDLELG